MGAGVVVGVRIVWGNVLLFFYDIFYSRQSFVENVDRREKKWKEYEYYRKRIFDSLASGQWHGLQQFLFEKGVGLSADCSAVEGLLIVFAIRFRAVLWRRKCLSALCRRFAFCAIFRAAKQAFLSRRLSGSPAGGYWKYSCGRTPRSPILRGM